jgi:DNA invertase Pin-like site-specific DNA recombinase
MVTMTTAIYAHCSSKESAVKDLSIQDKVERSDKKAKELNLEVLEVFRDEGFSAGVESRVCRPAFDKRDSKAKSGTFGHILCLSTSRFSRDPNEAEAFKRILELQRVNSFILASQGHDFILI